MARLCRYVVGFVRVGAVFVVVGDVAVVCGVAALLLLLFFLVMAMRFCG